MVPKHIIEKMQSARNHIYRSQQLLGEVEEWMEKNTDIEYPYEWIYDRSSTSENAVEDIDSFVDELEQYLK